MYKYFLILGISLTIHLGSSAQESWTLEKCIKEALTNSLLVKNADIAIENTSISQKSAKHSRYPSLNGSTGVFWNFGRTIDPTSNEFVTTTFFSNNVSLNSSILLYNGGRVNNTIKQADLDVMAATKDKEQVEIELVLSVTTAFINVLFAQENLENAQGQLLVTQQQLDQVDKLVRSGSRPANEKLDIEAQIATREQAIITNQNALDIGLLQLKQIMRVEPDVTVTIAAPENIEVSYDPEALTFAEVYASAVRTRKDVEAAEIRVNSSQLGKKIAKSSLYPSVGLGGSLGTNYSNQGRTIVGSNDVFAEEEVFINNQSVLIGREVTIPVVEKANYSTQFQDNLSYGFGVNVSIPIYNNYNNRASIQRAELNIMNAQNQLEQVKDQIKNTVQQVLADARAAKKSLVASEKSVIAQRAAFNNASRRYELGSINSFDLVTIQNQLDQAEINLIISRYDYLFKSKILDLYMGKQLSLN